MNATAIDILTNCTDRKKKVVPKVRRMASFSGGSHRIDRWWAALDRAPTEDRGPARDVYAGDHWAIAKELPETAATRGFDARLYVVSAGYGLIGSADTIAGYSASFGTDAADTIVKDKSGAVSEQRREWWAALSDRTLRGLGDTRSIQALVQQAPQNGLLVVVSPAYLDAIENDLLGALAVSSAPERIVLLTSAPGPRHRDLASRWVASTAAVQPVLGGALVALHARLARHLLERLPPEGISLGWAQETVARLAASAPTIERPSRTPATDKEVTAFIAKALRHNANATHTRLLREYRDLGHACEQSRFRTLFQTVRGDA